MASRTKVIAYAGVVAAAYFVVTVAVAPLSYGPIQFRVSEVLKPLGKQPVNPNASALGYKGLPLYSAATQCGVSFSSNDK